MSEEEKQGRDLIESLNRVYSRTPFRFELEIGELEEANYGIVNLYKFDYRFYELHRVSYRDSHPTQNSFNAVAVNKTQVRYTVHLGDIGKGNAIKQAVELMLAMEVGLPKPN